MFVQVSSFTITTDGQIERRLVEVLSLIKPAPITVRIVDGTERYEVLRMLRRMVDELEAMP